MDSENSGDMCSKESVNMKITDLAISLVGLIATLAYDNLSYNKDTSQSHTYPGPGYGAENAVDGNPATCMRTHAIGPNSPDKTVWWKVDLGGVYNIYSVNILFKNYDGFESRQRCRFAGFSLFIANTGERESSSLCYKDGPELPPLNFSTTCTLSGRYVIFYNERLDGYSYPAGYEVATNVFTELCEVTVRGCSNPGFYGKSCNLPCPNNCRYRTCHIENGDCFNCAAGYRGILCKTECPHGWYGVDCKQQCSGHCRDNVSCNHVTGHCDGGCAAGWHVSFCKKECDDGAYGYGCVNNCSGYCLNDTPCDKETGHCDIGCAPGYINAFCSQKCNSGTFGNGCTGRCSGNCLNNDVCHHIDGACTGGCMNGYIGKLCSKACIKGYYGRNCLSNCFPNCKICNPTDGTCTCMAGWTGLNCSIACHNYYGEDCLYPCSPLCVNQTCDRFNGTCLTACKNESFGDKCIYIAKYLPSKSKDTEEGALTVGLSISLGFNVILIFAASFLLWRHYRKVHPWTLQLCWKSPIYEISEHIGGQEQTYQELNLKENQRQNATNT
uniref:Multiple epidermal growth factor-like domains protein 6 isoform X2 n=1 Tax=Crassostrea virginica TaxID=6565 RepID=A0A8B8BRI1_CRAVI|nr:multiple epidermal growth factor-like domains protein 6 isoform X2 [Crassostrea virginica]